MLPDETPSPSPKNKVSLSLDLRLVIVVLLLVIAGMAAIWRPWVSKTSGDRTVAVTGEATIKAEPDEYLFYPSYNFKNTSKEAALAEVTAKSNAVVAQLKKLGIEDSKIKTNSSGYGDYYSISRDPGSATTTYTLSLTVTVGTRDLAQKVQDYLVTTSPTGAVSPQPTFSDAKRKELETQARDEATKDARAKAEQSAKNLGFKIGKVKQIQDDAGFGNIGPYFSYGSESLQAGGDNDKRQLTIQPGENDLNYAVKVVYFVR
jgi:uncharacterized protein YggE